jgi:hypothetical protein
MIRLCFVLAIAACGGKQTTSPTNTAGSGSATPAPDARTTIEKRRDTACESIGKKVTACALDDAKADLKAGKVTQKDFDLNTAPEVLRKNTEEFLKQCEVPMSSRQVRVLEVCFKEEDQCGPLMDCLTHLNDKVGK